MSLRFRPRGQSTKVEHRKVRNTYDLMRKQGLQKILMELIDKVDDGNGGDEEVETLLEVPPAGSYFP